MSFAGLRGALCEAPHLGRHHGEAAPRLAGARSLDRRIQRQQIGLARYLVDDADDVGYLARGCLDPAIASTACMTTSPPRSATSRALTAN